MTIGDVASICGISGFVTGAVLGIQRLIFGSVIGQHNSDKGAHGEMQKVHNEDLKAHAVLVVGRRHCDTVHAELATTLNDIKETMSDISGDIKVLNSNTKILMKKAGLNGGDS